MAADVIPKDIHRLEECRSIKRVEIKHTIKTGIRDRRALQLRRVLEQRQRQAPTDIVRMLC